MQALSNPSTITKEQIEDVIRVAEKGVNASAFEGSRVLGILTPLFALLMWMAGLGGTAAGAMLTIGGLGTGLLWFVEGRAKAAASTKRESAIRVWEEIRASEIFGKSESFKVCEIANEIARIYKIDPYSDVLPLSQAIRLVLVWKQQHEHLQIVATEMNKMQAIRETLLEKQRLLRELDDYNEGLERTVAHLEADLGPVERNHNLLLASCTRLEAILRSVEAAARRRQIHREVGQLTAQYPLTPSQSNDLELSHEHLDVERQITREINTFLQLERETDSHLREV